MLYGGVLAVFYVSLYCRIRLAILADVFGNTGCEALVALDGEMLSGSLPVKQQRILDGWLALHEEDLEYYCLDETHDCEIVREEVFTSNEFSAYIKMPIHSTYLLKIVSL